VARESFERLRRITGPTGAPGTAAERAEFVEWIGRAIAPRNVAGLADAARHHLYPVDFDVLVERHALLGLSRESLLERLPALRGLGPEPAFAEPRRRADGKSETARVDRTSLAGTRTGDESARMPTPGIS